MEGEQHEVDVFFDATESVGSPGTEVHRARPRSRSLQEIMILHDNAPPPPPPAMVKPPTLVYEERLKAVKDTRELIVGRMGLVLTICLLITPFVSACFVGVMTSSLVNCKSSWYVTLTSSTLAIPCVLGMMVLAFQICSLMDKYDKLWTDFDEVELMAVTIDPGSHESIDYAMWMSCCLVQIPAWRRNLIIYLLLISYICTVLLILAGPYLFLCGAFARPRPS